MHLTGFIGKATVAIDSKGRTNFPKELRRMMRPEAEGQVVVTIAEEKTLALYPIYAWNQYVTYLEKLGRKPEVAKFRQRITSMAKLSVLDGQNRLNLTPELITFSGLKGEVTFVGETNRVRLWQPEKFRQTIEIISPEEEEQMESLFYMEPDGDGDVK